MSRRRTIPKAGAIFADNRQTMINNIGAKFFHSVAELYPISVDPDNMLRALFPRACLIAMREAHKWTRHKNETYSHARYTITPGVDVTFPDWTKHGMAAPCDDAVEVDTDEPVMAKLLAWVRLVEQERRTWAVVERVVTYLDEHAHRSAVRYYFPAAITLLPGSARHHYENSRCIEPSGIGEYLPLIREAQNIMAAAAFLPSPQSPPGLPVMNVCFERASYAITTVHGAPSVITCSMPERTIPIWLTS